ncbi:MAG: L-seryl-tRNA(Sec) selenium transferase [Phototrophicaceae bacterium]
MTIHKLRDLPSINQLLQADITQRLITHYGRQTVLDSLRQQIDTARHALLNQQEIVIDDNHLIQQAQQHLENTFMPTLRPVLNATGVIIHTNLGRALLSHDAQQAVQAVASNYSNLEFTLETGKRGSRYLHAEELLIELTGAEAALVVNNNAAALVLALSALAQGQEVIISRSQLVEIGGGFRIPDIMVQSGAFLREIGTTNRTRISDYQAAITATTAMLLRVHSSNFRIVGFIENPTLEQIATTAHENQIIAADDLGSGAMVNTENYGLLHEPTVQESIAAGTDLVMFSGDKLLGGPQAGIMVGRADIIARLKKHPLARAMRADKLCYAALSATLDHYRRDEMTDKIPVWRMISATTEQLRIRAQQWRNALGVGEVITGESTVGGGSLPGTTLPTILLALDVPSASTFAMTLRQAKFPIVTRIQDDRVIFDPRTILPEQDELLIQILKKSL